MNEKSSKFKISKNMISLEEIQKNKNKTHIYVK